LALRRGVFLDLNGTLVEPVLVDRLVDLRRIPGVARAVATLNRAGFVCPVVTVQSRIEKQVFTAEAFSAWFRGFAAGLAAEGAELSGVYVCPHRFSTPCACRKPRTLLYERAAADLGLDLERSFTVGDTEADLEAARRFGGCGCLVRTGYAADRPPSQRATALAGTVGTDLQEVADWIVARGGAR
jgi:D-glycero-D-manno-heptose 1,7-bisphosphate phosphatase